MVGKGGMGAVYRAEDIKLGNRKVAVKEMSQSGLGPQEIKEAAEGFEREALILADLQHPNLRFWVLLRVLLYSRQKGVMTILVISSFLL